MKKLRKNKKGLEFTLRTVALLILGILGLGLMLYLAYKFGWKGMSSGTEGLKSGLQGITP